VPGTYVADKPASISTADLNGAIAGAEKLNGL
jgi:hypothetical protein